MSPVVKGGLVLAGAVAVLSVIVAVTGLHESPILAGLLFLVLAIALNVGIVFWTLKQTAAENGYGRQLVNAVLLGLFAGVLIFGFSFLMLTVLFPDYLEESQRAQIAMLEDQGLLPSQIEAQVARIEAATPANQSFAGFIGTLGTSLVAGAIVAAFVRRK